VLVRVDLRQIAFGQPELLWLLVVPAVLLALWVWQLTRRRMLAAHLRRGRTVPVRERFAPLGDLPFWLCLILSSIFLIFALARPHGPATAVRSGGVDVVILQDGSASMYVKDVGGSRWNRSINFLRIFGDSLSWNSDRIAMALFAHIAAPQIRLTKDPNTFFFFIDHLDAASPFRIEDETTWDTNLEQGIYWGIRLIERDEELHGKSPNARAFIMISDGENTWVYTPLLKQYSKTSGSNADLRAPVSGVPINAGARLGVPPLLLQQPLHLGVLSGALGPRPVSWPWPFSSARSGGV